MVHGAMLVCLVRKIAALLIAYRRIAAAYIVNIAKSNACASFESTDGKIVFPILDASWIALFEYFVGDRCTIHGQ